MTDRNLSTEDWVQIKVSLIDRVQKLKDYLVQESLKDEHEEIRAELVKTQALLKKLEK